MLPNVLTKQLYKAILEGRPDFTYKTLDLIEKQNQPLALSLREMVKGYRFDELRVLLESNNKVNKLS